MFNTTVAEAIVAAYNVEGTEYALDGDTLEIYGDEGGTEYIKYNAQQGTFTVTLEIPDDEPTTIVTGLAALLADIRYRYK